MEEEEKDEVEEEEMEEEDEEKEEDMRRTQSLIEGESLLHKASSNSTQIFPFR